MSQLSKGALLGMTLEWKSRNFIISELRQSRTNEYELGIEKPGFLPWINIVKAGLLSMNSSWKSSVFDCIWTSAVEYLGMSQVSNSRAFGNISSKVSHALPESGMFPLYPNLVMFKSHALPESSHV